MANVFGGSTIGFGSTTQQSGMTQPVGIAQQGGYAQQSGGGGGGGGNNEILVSQARAAMETFKNQTASELGIQNYAQQYKGDLPSRVNGSVGGYMVKKMIALAEQQLNGGAGGTTTGGGTMA